MKGAEVLHNSIAKSVGNGFSTRFWLDKWVNDLGPLINYVSQPSLIANPQISVAEMFNQGIDSVKTIVPNLIFMQIEAHGPPTLNGPQNKLI